MKILFCQLKNHGDIIRIFPLLDAIKYYYPGCTIGFTCFEEMVETCKLSKSIDIIIPQPKFLPVTDTQGGTRILDCSIFYESVEKVKKEKFDIYVDLHGVFQSAVYGVMCNIKIRLGRSKETSKDGACIFYTDICEIKTKEINRMERHFVIFNKLFPEVKPFLNNTNKKSGKVLIFPGSSKMGYLKRWKTERYIEVGEKLNENENVHFILGPAEKELSHILKEKTNLPVYLYSNWDGIIEELKDAKLVIGNDSAYLHLAVWKKIPAIMLCGALSPIVNGVWKYGRGEALYNTDCKCPDVWKGICYNRDHYCMDQILVEDVIEATKKYL